MLLAAVDASVESLKHQLLRVHREVKDVAHAKLKLEEALKNGLDKYAIRKMATGSIDDFHKGLSDRIGKKKSRAFIPLSFQFRFITLEQVLPVLIFSMQCAWNA